MCEYNNVIIIAFMSISRPPSNLQATLSTPDMAPLGPSPLSTIRRDRRQILHGFSPVKEEAEAPITIVSATVIKLSNHVMSGP